MVAFWCSHAFTRCITPTFCSGKHFKVVSSAMVPAMLIQIKQLKVPAKCRLAKPALSAPYLCFNYSSNHHVSPGVQARDQATLTSFFPSEWRRFCGAGIAALLGGHDVTVCLGLHGSYPVNTA